MAQAEEAGPAPPNLRHHLVSLPKATGFGGSKPGSSHFWAPQEDFGVCGCLFPGAREACRNSEQRKHLLPPGPPHLSCQRLQVSVWFSSPPKHPVSLRLLFCLPCFFFLPATPCGSTMLALCHPCTSSKAAVPPDPQILPTAAESFVYQLT